MNAISAPAWPGYRHARPAPRRGRAARLLLGRPGDPAWARPAMLGLLLVTAVLYLAGLSRSGYANEFYAAAVQAGTKSWKAFLFGSLDSSSFITVDKTPASLWVMELSGRIFGFSSWSLLAPQAAEGVAAAGLLYATVRRWSGPAAGLIAAGVLAITPVAVLMFRFDNPDALLVLVLTTAAYATTRAIESGRARWMVLAGALLGLGYLTKMLQALLVLPAFALAYLWAGRPSLRRRIGQLLAAGAAMVAAAGWWVAIDLLTPAAGRPYVGGSTDNNILQLTFGYNGLGRLTGSGSGPGSGASGGGSMFGGATGLNRLFAADMGGQVSWLLPAALIFLAGLAWASRRAPRTDRTRAAVLLWGGWLLVTGLVFSFMAGIMHPYYTVALAPAIGALAGIGSVWLWSRRRSLAARGVLAGTVAVTAAWASVLLGRSGWLPWLRVAIAVAAVAAAALILAGPAIRRRAARGAAVAPAAAVSLALAAGLAGPAAYSLSTAAAAHGGSSPTAGPAVAASFAGGAGTGRGGVPGAAGRAGGSAAGSGATGSGATGSGRAGSGAAGSGATGSGRAGAGQRPAGLPGAGGRPGSGSAAAGQAPAAAPGRSGEMAAGTARDGAPDSAGGLGGHGGSGGTGGTGGSGGTGGPGGTGGGTVSRALARLLASGAHGYRWAAATVGSSAAASLELGSGGVPVMAIGGFTGSDPAPTLAQFTQLVARHEIRYFVTAGTGGAAGAAGGPGGSGYGSQITAWVQAHFTARTVGGMTVYDLGSTASGS